ncbi:neutral/alkaline non-lysosomal ceramidase N-terminal domain-containing protein [Rhodopirellula sp. P2]|uniref:neutral/alkaline non-lysosomal ceramidase N-terminal domain-containing protein n=1 Tax=Rhodopirellula sp. P2 TaxID=2127060 RepID=UPI00236788CB|nr:neutral/alkaline non-lysosomal ceramidase N-terminal domain-containing protein [Rhodopirellula sp. P2]WDQ17862.1 neutral/alkaline non-lysosomal ceramidase N-terminal domain-containing protein [Rhodopirellula sp. P2]
MARYLAVSGRSIWFDRQLPFCLIIGILVSASMVGGQEPTPSNSTVEAASESDLLIGSAQREITPPTGFPMSGYFHERLATETRDPLFAKAMVFEQGDTVVVWVVCDLVGITRDLYEEVIRRSESLHGIPAKNHLVSATHSHTAPDYRAHLVRHLRGELKEESPYAEKLVNGIVGAIGDAISSKRSAKILAGNAIQSVPVSFNRRSVMKDGSILTWQRESNPERIRSAGPIDDQLGVIAVLDSETNQPFTICSSYALHLDTVGGTRWSADYPALMQRAVAENFGDDVLSIFGAGTCGDINHADPSRQERNSCEFIGHSLGETLVKEARSMLEGSIKTSPSPKSRLKYRQAVVPLPLQTLTEQQIDRAKALIPLARGGEKVAFEDLVAANRDAQLDRLTNNPSWIDGDDPANVSPMIAWQGIGDHLPVEVATITLGDELAIVFLPGEVFVDLGLAIKRHSPFETTLVIELSNCVETAYLPTHAAYAQGSYEVINSRTQPGSGEKLVSAALTLLRSAASDDTPTKYELHSELTSR